jgi:SMC interacting uncharacterized protein involved in chromosome segregation
MAEQDDVVVPILRNIQADLAETKREMRDGFAEMRTNFNDLAERMNAFEGYFTYTMGLTTQAKADIQKLQEEVRSLKKRGDDLERQT